jgi:hypothetical protein
MTRFQVPKSETFPRGAASLPLFACFRTSLHGFKRPPSREDNVLIAVSTCRTDRRQMVRGWMQRNTVDCLRPALRIASHVSADRWLRTEPHI